MSNQGGWSGARLDRMHKVLAGYVESGEIPGLVALVSRRGEVYVDAIGEKAVGGAPIGRDTLDHLPQNRIVGAVVALLIFVGLATLLLRVWPIGTTVASQPVAGSTEAIGQSMFRDYVLPFEVVSFLLLAALIGAIVLARKDDGGAA